LADIDIYTHVMSVSAGLL